MGFNYILPASVHGSPYRRRSAPFVGRGSRALFHGTMARGRSTPARMANRRLSRVAA